MSLVLSGCDVIICTVPCPVFDIARCNYNCPILPAMHIVLFFHTYATPPYQQRRRVLSHRHCTILRAKAIPSHHLIPSTLPLHHPDASPLLKHHSMLPPMPARNHTHRPVSPQYHNFTRTTNKHTQPIWYRVVMAAFSWGRIILWLSPYKCPDMNFLSSRMTLWSQKLLCQKLDEQRGD